MDVLSPFQKKIGVNQQNGGDYSGEQMKSAQRKRKKKWLEGKEPSRRLRRVSEIEALAKPRENRSFYAAGDGGEAPMIISKIVPIKPILFKRNYDST